VPIHPGIRFEHLTSVSEPRRFQALRSNVPSLVSRVPSSGIGSDRRWELTGLQYVNRWRRFVPDRIASIPAGTEATAFFDQVVKTALNR